MEKATHSGPPAAIERFSALALRREVSLGVLLSTHPRDFAVALAAAAQSFAAQRAFNEREVNALLRDFLAGAGSMLGSDHVELRRWLVDFHLLDRDGYGRAYTAGTPTADFADIVRQLGGVDLRSPSRATRAGSCNTPGAAQGTLAKSGARFAWLTGSVCVAGARRRRVARAGAAGLWRLSQTRWMGAPRRLRPATFDRGLSPLGRRRARGEGR
jgi:hypothetical protein